MTVEKRLNYYNYFTETEEHFVRRRGKHLWVSPLDWSLIAAWRQSGVPLHVALRGIDKAMDGFQARPRRKGKVNTLFFCHDAVMEEFARHLDSHTGEAPPSTTRADVVAGPEDKGGDPGLGKQAIADFLAARIAEIRSLRAKHFVQERPELMAGVDRILARLDEIARDLLEEGAPASTPCERRGDGGVVDEEALDRDLSILDDTLMQELRPAVPEDRVAGWEKEARRDLRIYRKRLPKETYQKITENFMRRKIHGHFEVGELSLFYL